MFVRRLCVRLLQEGVIIYFYLTKLWIQCKACQSLCKCFCSIQYPPCLFMNKSDYKSTKKIFPPSKARLVISCTEQCSGRSHLKKQKSHGKHCSSKSLSPKVENATCLIIVPCEPARFEHMYWENSISSLE